MLLSLLFQLILQLLDILILILIIHRFNSSLKRSNLFSMNDQLLRHNLYLMIKLAQLLRLLFVLGFVELNFLFMGEHGYSLLFDGILELTDLDFMFFGEIFVLFLLLIGEVEFSLNTEQFPIIIIQNILHLFQFLKQTTILLKFLHNTKLKILLILTNHRLHLHFEFLLDLLNLHILIIL